MSIFVPCSSLFWQSLHHSVSPRDCFHFGEKDHPIGHWYGGGESLQAHWPLETGHIERSPFITGDEVSDKKAQSEIIKVKDCANLMKLDSMKLFLGHFNTIFIIFC